MIPAHEAANGDAERYCQRRQDALVGGFAGFQALDRARENGGCCRQLEDAVAACKAEAYDTRREWFDENDSVASVTASDEMIATFPASLLRLGAPVGGLDRVAD